MRNHLGARFAWIWPLVLAAVASNGCQRAFYRQQADAEAYALIDEKNNNPHWQMPRYSIDIDPRSRMFNPYDPDREPMPPDDPTSHQYMHEVDRKRGYPHWHANGDIDDTQNPDWRAFLPLNEEGVLVLDAGQAVQLALLHSNDYQQQMETLYLSALDVSFERFRFDTQFFGNYNANYRADGPLRSAAGPQSVLALEGLPVVSAERLFSTGSELVVGFANSLVWQFAGPNDYSTSTVLDLTLIQPLLRGAGRDRVLERLTLSERTLLANVRQMERYRRAFYVEILTGRDAGSGAARQGGVFGAGLEGFTGLGSSAFGRLGTSGSGFTGGTGAGQAGGFMGLLQSEQEIRNQQDNLNSLRSNYFRLLVNLQELMTTVPEQSESIVRQRLQVAQARTAMLNAESRLLNSKTAYQSQLDAFKTTLGLPPDICVRVNDPMLEKVSLIDPKIRPVQDRVSDLQRRVGDVILDLLPAAGEAMEWDDTKRTKLTELRELLNEVETIRRLLMDGDEAQIRRIMADGMKLARKLQETLAAAQAEAAGENGDPAFATEARQDLELLERILQRIAQRDDWLERLSGFHLLRDVLDDLNRIQQQLAAGGLIDLDWMRTDSNPTTRQLYQKYQTEITALNQLTVEQQGPPIQQLLAAMAAERQTVVSQLEQVLAGNPWLAELDRWRISPDEVEIATDKPQRIEVRRLKRLFAQFIDTMIDVPGKFNELPAKIQAYQAKIDGLIADGPSLTSQEFIARFRQDVSPDIPQELVELSEGVLVLSLMQARDRAETVSLVEVDLHPAMALEIARTNRRDWMNRRAALVDAWRLIEFNADNLESSLDVVFNGDIRNRNDNPFSLDAATGTLRVGLRFDTPLIRLTERNTYRQALIEYQQTRRSYYLYEDSINRSLRDTLRTMYLNRENFEIRREAVRAADLQIELNEDIRKLQEASRAPSGPTAARDAVSALSDLLQAQNDFLSVWVTYELLRRTLDLDLGTMQLDSEGMWIDPGPIGPETGYPGVEVDLEDPCWPGPLDVQVGTCGPVCDCPDSNPIP
ncbi:MAG: TolC family protein [Pirellulaceae bacterium]|nr:TolC family protein [Pirellulaceae bacterium]